MEIAALASFAVLLASWVMAPDARTPITEGPHAAGAPGLALEPTPAS